MERTTKTSGATRSDKDRGRLVSALLTGSWRQAPSTPTLTADELTAITLPLCGSSSGPLAWWRIRHSSLANSAAGMQLHEVYRRSRLSALIHEREIKHVFSLLRAAGIEPVLVKGWAIARRYPDPALRPYGDIDLCVRPDQFAQAQVALKCLENIDGHYVDLHDGFGKLTLECGDLSPLWSAALRQLRSDSDLLLTRGESGDRSPHSKAVRGWNALFERSQLVDLGDEKVRVLSDEDHLRILCLHLLRSGAWRPLWLCDVALALETLNADFNWDLCLGRDRRQAESVACAIGLAQQLLGVETSDARCQMSGVKSPISAARLKLFPGSAGVPPAGVDQIQPSLPRWLVPAVLRQWGRGVNPDTLTPALPSLLGQLTRPAKLLSELRVRLDHPVRATVAVRGRFNNWPRLPYQLVELFLRGAEELPKQLRVMRAGVLSRESGIVRKTLDPGLATPRGGRWTMDGRRWTGNQS